MRLWGSISRVSGLGFGDEALRFMTSFRCFGALGVCHWFQRSFGLMAWTKFAAVWTNRQVARRGSHLRSSLGPVAARKRLWNPMPQPMGSSRKEQFLYPFWMLA